MQGREWLLVSEIEAGSIGFLISRIEDSHCLPTGIRRTKGAGGKVKQQEPGGSAPHENLQWAKKLRPKRMSIRVNYTVGLTNVKQEPCTEGPR